MEIELKWNSNEQGAFVIDETEGRTAEMVFGVSGDIMTILHTEVADKHKGRGVAGQLLDRMAGYARQNKLRVFPRCAYVQAQFKRHPERYSDIWHQG